MQNSIPSSNENKNKKYWSRLNVEADLRVTVSNIELNLESIMLIILSHKNNKKQNKITSN